MKKNLEQRRSPSPYMPKLRRASSTTLSIATILVMFWNLGGTAAGFEIPTPDPPSSQADVDAYQTDSVWYDPTSCGAVVDTKATTGVTDPGGDTSLNLNANQVKNAKTIIGIAKTENLGKRGATIGLITAIVESHITNQDSPAAVPLSKGMGDPGDYAPDKDSIGVFQQRPSQGWSTVAGDTTNSPDGIKQLMTVAYQAEAFFGSPPGAQISYPPGTSNEGALKKGMQNISDWQTRTDMGAVAQDVQRSGFPDRYAKQIDNATAIVNAFWDTTAALALPIPINGSGGGAGEAGATPSGPAGQSCCPDGAAAATGDGRTIVLDPGHSGDPGYDKKDPATGIPDYDYPSDSPEMKDVFDVAQRAQQALTTAGYTVKMTKEKWDSAVGLRARADFMKTYHAALGVSIHTQASNSGGGGLAWQTANNIVYPQAVGLYRTTSKADGRKHVPLTEDHAAVATLSQKYTDIFKQQRTAAEGHTVRRIDEVNGRAGDFAVPGLDDRLPSAGNIWMVQLFAGLDNYPWVYNEAGGDSAGQKGLNEADRQKYADGIVKSVEAAIPLTTSGSNTGNVATETTSTSAPTCVVGDGATGDLFSTIKTYAWPTYHSAPFPSSKAQYETAMKPEYLAAVKEAQAKHVYVGGGQYPGVDCGGFVTLVFRNSGADPNYNSHMSNVIAQQKYITEHPELYDDVSKLIGHQVASSSDLKPGDIYINNDMSHTYIFIGTGIFPNYNAASASFSTTGASWRTPMASPAYGFTGAHWWRLKTLNSVAT
ncbi:MAG TPA: N-acetylmuramoyl-L-alanine amidase [Bacillota bacterium]|nr:N-acetylmuramoyl-L-alanine amidase [Bacillota bacterium]